MERINGQLPDEAELAKDVLMWIIYSLRSIKTAELQHAVAIEPGTNDLDQDNITEVEDMISVCAGLVTIDEESQIVRLVHYTTQEYFDRTKHQWFSGANEYLATACVTYLAYDNFSENFDEGNLSVDPRTRPYRLLKYASKYWAYHSRFSDSCPPAVITFLEKNKNAQAAYRVQRVLISSSSWTPFHLEYYTGLHYAVFERLETVVVALMARGNHDVNAIAGNYGWTPLICAARYGSAEIVRMLIDAGADLNYCSHGKSALTQAIYRGNRDVITILLEAGVDVNADNALIFAVVEEDFQTVTTLLGMGAKFDLKAMKYIEFDPNMADLLLANMPDVDIQDEKGKTSLGRAARFPATDVLSKILRRKVNIHLQDNYGRTALYHAVKGRSVACVWQLIEVQADISIKPCPGEVMPVRTLQDLGSRALGNLLMGALELYVSHDYNIPTVNIVLDKDDYAAFSKSPDNYTSWLHFEYALDSHQLVVQELVRKGAACRIKCTDKPSILLVAVLQGSYDIARLLLDAGAVFNEECIPSSVIVSFFCEGCRIIRNYGIPQDSPGFSLLDYTIYAGSKTMYLLLLKFGTKLRSEQISIVKGRGWPVDYAVTEVE